MIKWRLFWTVFPAVLVVSAITTIFGGFYFNSVYKDQNFEYREKYLILSAKGQKENILKNFHPQLTCPFSAIKDSILYLSPLGDQCGNLNSKDPLLPQNLFTLSLDTLLPRDADSYWYLFESPQSAGRILLKIHELRPQPNFFGKTFLTKYALPGIVVTLLISYAFSRIISRPVETLEAGALRFSTGDLKQHLSGSHWFEFDSLSKSLNNMASQLDEKLRNLVKQSNELKSVLSSMNEGVIAIDKHNRVMNMNKGAKELLELPKVRRRLKRPLQELLGESELNRAAEISQQEGKFAMGDFVSGENFNKVLEYRITPLKNMKGNIVGSLIVLTDVTRLRHLENVRKDFVANVSHELRTPITSIQGFAETLLMGVPEEQSKNFLQIISRQSNRLTEIINDLTELAKLDQLEGTGQLEKSLTNIQMIFEQAVQTVSPLAEKKEIKIEVHVDENLHSILNGNLIEQAVVNLVANSIKYSDPNKVIKLSAETNNNQLTLLVVDQGFGIPTPHLKRIFERFYRIDKARSRDLGGTGLGLAIVNHIARAHGGVIEVWSEQGQGSRFSILLPHVTEG